MRSAMVLAFIGVIAFGIYLFQSTAGRHARRAVTNSPSVSVDESTTERRLAVDRVSNDKTESAKAPPSAKKSSERPAGDSEEPKGPFEIDLGEHTLHFKQDRGHAIRTKIIVRVPDTKTRNEVFRKRRSLKRMLYFLGSKRRLEGARGDAGKSRFRRDLEIRFGNVIRNGQLLALELPEYEVVEVDLPELETP